VSEKVTGSDAERAHNSEPPITAIVAADENGLRRLAELLMPYLPVPAAPCEPDRWLTTREAAEYAGTSPNALHKAMAARALHFEQDTPGGKAWFKRADIDAWRRGERPAAIGKRAA
jgi:helix-turn-helix protein